MGYSRQKTIRHSIRFRLVPALARATSIPGISNLGPPELAQIYAYHGPLEIPRRKSRPLVAEPISRQLPDRISNWRRKCRSRLSV